MRRIHMGGFFVEVVVIYDQEKMTEIEALEAAVKELKAEIIREKARQA